MVILEETPRNYLISISKPSNKEQIWNIDNFVKELLTHGLIVKAKKHDDWSDIWTLKITRKGREYLKRF